MITEILSGGAVAGIVWLTAEIQRRSTRVKVADIKDAAKEVFQIEIMPALDKFQISLLKEMNGTYLRSAEARVHFASIQSSIERLEHKL